MSNDAIEALLHKQKKLTPAEVEDIRNKLRQKPNLTDEDVISATTYPEPRETETIVDIAFITVCDEEGKPVDFLYRLNAVHGDKSHPVCVELGKIISAMAQVIVQEEMKLYRQRKTQVVMPPSDAIN